MSDQKSVAQLPAQIAALTPSDRTVVERIFSIITATGEMKAPPEALETVKMLYGQSEAGLKQSVIKVTNKVTLECSVYNPLRALRPQEKISGALDKLIEEARVDDQFARPLEQTSYDVFGRIEGRHSITASNIAKADGWHSVIVFNEYHPHKFNEEQVIDYLFTAREWAARVQDHDPEAAYFFFLWNCLWKAGASQVHGHAQALLTREMHYGAVERLRRDTQAYDTRYRRNYFADLVNASRALGLTADPADRVKAVVSLTPLREREIWLITDDYSPEFGQAIYRTLDFFRASGVQAFNLAIQMPPIRPVNESWNGFPVIARILDRGNPLRRQADVGAIELYAASIITVDPFKLAEDFRVYLLLNK